MLKAIVLPGITLLASAGVSLGMPAAPSPAERRFVLDAPPAPSAGHRPPRTRGVRVFTRAGDGLFYVNAMVNGAPVRFVVDTGSNVVVLTRRDAARIGMPSTDAGSVAMQTVGGATRMHSGTVDRIEIAGQSIENVDAAMVENGLNVSLLGQSALSQLDSIRFAGDRLELN